MTQQFITGLELNKEANLKLLNLALQIKNNPTDFAESLKGKSVVTLFEKPKTGEIPRPRHPHTFLPGKDPKRQCGRSDC